VIIRFRSLNYDWIVADPVSISGYSGTDHTARTLRCSVWVQIRPLLSALGISKLQTNLCFNIYVDLRELKIVVAGLLGRNSDVRPDCATLVDFRPTWSQVYSYRLDGYKYKRSSRPNTSFGFSAFLPFALFPCFSKIHLYPRSQRFSIWLFVPIDPGISSRLSTTAFTSRTARWRLLTDRSLWNPEDGESCFWSSIVCLRSLLEAQLDFM